MTNDSQLTTIPEVLSELDRIVDTTIRDNSPLGIFAFIYRRTTAKILEGIDAGRFEDGDRMERFDVAFARMYIDAFWGYREERKISSAWNVAFSAAGDTRFRPIIVQHLLLGMNAHINLDLGIAAARVAPGSQIDALKNDFMTVNTLLAELIDEMQERISRVSPLMFLLDWIGKRDDEAIVNFSISKAREFAWILAQNLAHADEDQQNVIIRKADGHITGIGNIVARPPGFLLPKLLGVIRRFEEQDVRNVIKGLKE